MGQNHDWFTGLSCSRYGTHARPSWVFTFTCYACYTHAHGHWCTFPDHYHTIPYHIIPYHTISYHIIPYHARVPGKTAPVFPHARRAMLLWCYGGEGRSALFASNQLLNVPILQSSTQSVPHQDYYHYYYYFLHGRCLPAVPDDLR